MADTPITIAKTRVTPLEGQERWNGYNTRFKVKAADIAFGAGATDTVTLTLGMTPARWTITRALINVTTSFVGTGTQTCTATLGTTNPSDVDSIIESFDFFGAVGQKVASTGPNTVKVIANCTATTTSTVKFIITSAAASGPAGITAGELDIYLNILDLDYLG